MASHLTLIYRGAHDSGCSGHMTAKQAKISTPLAAEVLIALKELSITKTILLSMGQKINIYFNMSKKHKLRKIIFRVWGVLICFTGLIQCSAVPNLAT